MTNKERYQRTFSALHASGELNLEVNKITMSKTKKRHISKFTAICAAAVLAAGMCTTAYAADVGGIQRTIQIWLHGDQTSAELNIEQGDHTTYTMTYEDENGDKKEVHGGGVAFDMWGNEVPLTEEDIMRDVINVPDVTYNDDGTVFVYCMDQKIDITDKFDEDGICFTQVKAEDVTYYLTISKDGGYSMSTTSYPSAKELMENTRD
jgi:hypothetical protein